MAFETSRGYIIYFDSGLNKSDMTGVCDGYINKDNSAPNDNKIPHYYYPSEEHNDVW